ncbi:MAG TPA: SUMF1/EgtB/PvdO family nonheme iron enzyme [Myxococcota bacterium]|jgi:formylglycine-generating enzyme required for sulfatase activity|nr:SUMF1/EgtB/PvdO family nonheme iron enzyme [Myxococcota bacterium]
MRAHVVLAVLLVAPPAGALTLESVTVGNPNNAADTPPSNCDADDCGSVPYVYAIGKYEVTNAEYAEFLNAKAASDPFALYDTRMGSDASFGGITRSGSDGDYTYAVKAGFEDEPVVFVSYYDALRLANWLHNGQGTGDTETGAYAVTFDGIVDNTIVRAGGATVFVPSENEWYKAAYYDPALSDYYDYPAGADDAIGCVAPASDTGNSANCGNAQTGLTDVGAYPLSVSPYGTLDQGGNVWEWNEEIVGSGRGLRGGSWNFPAGFTAASGPDQIDPMMGYSHVGLRLASVVVPEPAQLLLALIGALVLSACRLRA